MKGRIKKSMSGKTKAGPLPTIGWREWLFLPDLGTTPIKAKVDTGARTSSLHAIHVREFIRDGMEMVSFQVHPLQRSTKEVFTVEAPLLDRRPIKPSSGHVETRPVILTTVELMGQRWELELTLTSRDQMGFRMLLGRQAIRGHFLVNPARSYLNGRSPRLSEEVSPAEEGEW